jgi:YVTN family beta-propeller protein
MRKLACTALLLASTSALTATAQSQGRLLVLSKHDHTLSIVDPGTLKVTARMPVGENPHEVVASADGTRAYVSNYDPAPGNFLAVLDLNAHKALPHIDLGPLERPHGLAFAGGKAYFTAETNKAIGSYDPAKHKVDWVLGIGQNRTHMVNVSPDAKHIVTTNVNSATVSLIDLVPMKMTPPKGAPAGPPPPPMEGLDWNETVIPVGHGDEGFDISPNRREIWTANAQDGTVTVIDYTQKRVVATLHTDTASANRLKFTPDGRLVLVSLLDGTDLVVIDASTRKVVKRIPIGHGAAGIVMQPDGSRAFIGCTADNYVAVIDLKKLTLAGKIDAGGEPDGMFWVGH